MPVDDGSADNPELQQELAARRASDERMHFALAAARIGVWEWDLSSDDITWSSTNRSCLWGESGLRPLIGRCWPRAAPSDLFHRL